MAKVLGKFWLHNRDDEIYGCLVLGFKTMMWAFGFIVAVPTTPKILNLSKFWSPLTKHLSSIYTLIRFCILVVAQVPLGLSKEYEFARIQSLTVLKFESHKKLGFT